MLSTKSPAGISKRKDKVNLPIPEWVVEFLGTISYFKSTMGLPKLSNFSELERPIEVDGFWFPSSEHAYQALYRVAPEFRWGRLSF
jgi:hypothetical protein